jgi:integrase
MRAVLTDYAPRPGGHQKKELSWALLERLRTTMESSWERGLGSSPSSATRWMARRDWAMIAVGYFFLLRRSEVVRMRKGDVSMLDMEVAGRRIHVLQVYVHEKSKNDRERRGHVRVAAGRPGRSICVLRALARYLLEGERSEPPRIAQPDDPLFPRLEGGPMAADTPNGRLQHWLEAAGVQEPRRYGFHSLRAGAATEAYRNGATEEWIKQHGNWKSDAVKVYIRQGIEERLATTAMLGQGSSRAAVAVAGRSL